VAKKKKKKKKKDKVTNHSDLPYRGDWFLHPVRSQYRVNASYMKTDEAMQPIRVGGSSSGLPRGLRTAADSSLCGRGFFIIP